MSLHFSRFEALPDSLKRYASENLERIQALANKLATSGPIEQNNAIREAGIEDLKLLVNLRTASVTSREMGTLEIHEREDKGRTTAFPVDPKRDLSRVINMNESFDSVEPVQTASTVERPYAREAKAFVENLGALHSESDQRRALWGARTTVLKSLGQLETVSPEIKNAALVELRERGLPNQGPYAGRYVKEFERLPDSLKEHAIENLVRVQALAERLEAPAPNSQNEAIRKAGIEDLKILVRLATASMTARQMATIEIEAREKGKPTAFPER